MKAVPVVPVALVMGTVIVNGFFIQPAKPSTPPDYSGYDEALLTEAAFSVDAAAFTETGDLLFGEEGYDKNAFAGFMLMDGSSVVNASPALSETAPVRQGVLRYVVKENDTLSSIAAKFGISVNTIVWANKLSNSGFIKPGQEIEILPVSGVLHEVRTGERLEGIASLYKVSVEDIKTFNKAAKVQAGDTIIVPNAKPAIQESRQSNLPKTDDYLIMPVADGWNWGVLHNSAVDVSGACGAVIAAAAEGMVSEVGDPADWNSGFGGYVRIKHPMNGIETLYAHTSENLVSVGDYVEKGEEIAKIGNTGRVKGPTGCHVHFGVFGAQHPFAK